VQNTSPPDAITPRIIEIVREPSASIDMIQVAIAAFGLTGVIMASAAVAGLLAGALFIWYRRRRPISTIEARGHEHNLFRVR
ncbi:MAG: hypothetical protein ACRELX_08690, partial [Longimicrobiales bacterium]